MILGTFGVLIFLVSLGDSVSQWEYGLEKEWIEYKERFGKVYTPEKDKNRFSTFSDTYINIQTHNIEFFLGLKSYEMGLNQFSDMNFNELKSRLNCIKRPDIYSKRGSTFLPPNNVHIPDHVDWRTKGYVTAVQYQGYCGSCWAFSATGSLEGQHKKKTGKLVKLSEQQLIDCDKFDGGCAGGYMDNAFKYIKENGGIDTEKSYPYEGKNDTCRFNKKTIGATCTGYVDLPKKNETALKIAVATVGPISAAMYVPSQFFHYNKGIFKIDNCDSDPAHLDHGVLVVGYGTSSKGQDYWIIKNSWSTDWGIKGYGLMARNYHNMCGIADCPSYPTV